MMERTVSVSRYTLAHASATHRSLVLHAGANHSDLHEQRTSGFPTCTHLLLQNEIRFESTLRSLEKACEEGICTVFNPSPMLSSHQVKSFPWEKVSWLLINEGEAKELYKGFTGIKDDRLPPFVEILATELTEIEQLKKTNILITLGAKGVLALAAAWRTPEGRLSSGFIGTPVPAATLEGDFRDTTGAGDCFTGYFVAGLMEEFGREAAYGGDKGKERVEKILRVCCQVRGQPSEVVVD